MIQSLLGKSWLHPEGIPLSSRGGQSLGATPACNPEGALPNTLVSLMFPMG